MTTPPSGLARVIGLEARSLTTSTRVTDLATRVGREGVARLAVVERHHRTGRVGHGYVHGFGLSRGAFASTVGHDAHNVMLVGALDDAGAADMSVAAGRLAELGGGQVVVLAGEVLAELPLPIGGLMSDRPAGEVADALHALTGAASRLGVSLPAPFMQLSFLGLSVLPELRLTDRGLIDVGRFEVVPVAVD